MNTNTAMSINTKKGEKERNRKKRQQKNRKTDRDEQKVKIYIGKKLEIGKIEKDRENRETQRNGKIVEKGGNVKNKEKKKWENERDLGKIYGENKEKERQVKQAE